jgi:hypothetical protein
MMYSDGGDAANSNVTTRDELMYQARFVPPKSLG